MSLIARLTSFFPVSPRRLALGFLAWGLLSVIVVPITNHVYGQPVGSTVWWAALFATVAALIGLYVVRVWVSNLILAAHTRHLGSLWERVGESLLRAELLGLDRLPGLRGQLSGDLSVIGSSIQPIFFLIQSAAILLASAFVVFLSDGRAVLIWCVTFGAVAVAIWPGLKEGAIGRGVVARRRGDLDQATQDLVGGLIAARMDRGVGDALGGRVLDAAEVGLGAWRTAALRTEYGFQTGIVLVYLVGFLPAAFSDPQQVGVDSETAFALVMMLSQGLGPTFGILHNLPEAYKFMEATARIEASVASLNEVSSANASTAAAWRTLRLCGLRYSYGNGFGLGPIDLELTPGELVFVTGGNGSGKSTLMRSLLGLQPPTAGWVEWDGQSVSGAQVAAYRQLFTALFNEVHLFDKLYGLSASREEVQASLARLGLQGVVDLDGDSFTTLSLSTGQRKRLAMVVALLEDRPICVFDEWTANLDPETTRFYYDELLPALQKKGKTVVAVSHDDRYFDRADRVLAMENGRIVSDTRRRRA